MKRSRLPRVWVNAEFHHGEDKRLGFGMNTLVVLPGTGRDALDACRDRRLQFVCECGRVRKQTTTVDALVWKSLVDPSALVCTIVTIGAFSRATRAWTHLCRLLRRRLLVIVQRGC